MNFSTTALTLAACLTITPAFAGVDPSFEDVPETMTPAELLDQAWENAEWFQRASNRPYADGTFDMWIKGAGANNLSRTCTHSISSDGKHWFNLNEGVVTTIDREDPQLQVVLRPKEGAEPALITGTLTDYEVWMSTCTEDGENTPW